jgi:hypothetical protein
MDLARVAAGGLAVNRTLFGLSYLARPASARSSWIGRAARRPGAQVMIRSQGIRDVALGAGALRTLARGDDAEAGAWMAGHALVDATDLAVTWAARDRLPADAARLALAVAGASTAVAVASAVALSRAREPAPASRR